MSATTKFDPNIYHAFQRIETILRPNALAAQHPLQESAFIEMMIGLHDLLWKAHSIGKRISFSEDLNLFPGVKDITDAIRECRNALCHMYALV